MSSKVLILGSRGMLGTDLVKIFADKSDVVAWDREDIDVTQEAEVMSKIIPLEPQLIINATGYTNVDGAEDDAASAFLLNGVSVDYLVKAAASLGAKLIHFSTEYVFDGTNQAGYKEDVATNPLNVYGQSKAAGEKYIVGYGNGYLIRSSWLFGHAPQRGKPRGLNFIDAVIKLSQEQPEVKIVNDQFGKPTATKDLAVATYNLWHSNNQPGIYHIVNEGVATWYDVAKEVFLLENITIPLVGIASADYPVKATRPQHAVLLNTKLPHLRTWQEALKEYLS